MAAPPPQGYQSDGAFAASVAEKGVVTVSATTTNATARQVITMAMGPHGSTEATDPSRAAVASDGDGNGWHIAVLFEAALATDSRSARR